MSKVKARKPPRKVPLEKKALAAAKVLVEGKSLRQAADEVGVSRDTAHRAARDAEKDPDLRRYLTAYRARALPKWLQVLDKATDAALDALEGAEGRDIAALVKAFSDLANRAAGEADVTHDHRGQLEGARESLAAKIAAVADAGTAGGGDRQPDG